MKIFDDVDALFFQEPNKKEGRKGSDGRKGAIARDHLLRKRIEAVHFFFSEF